MEGRIRSGERHDPGGIAELARLVDEHGPALDYDLITRTRYQLRDIGGALSWGALRHFVQFLPRSSALHQDIQPYTDAERWTRGDATASLLADIYDLLAMMRAEAAVKGTEHKPRRPKPHPRPGMKPMGTTHIGKDPIPISEFEDWWDSKGR